MTRRRSAHADGVSPRSSIASCGAAWRSVRRSASSPPTTSRWPWSRSPRRRASGATTSRRRAPARGRRRWVRLGAAALVALSLGGAFVWGRRSAERPVPRFQRLTFRRGNVEAARFTPDGQTVLYSARWAGEPSRLFSVRLDGIDSRDLGLEAVLMATTTGEMAVVLPSGTLARLPLEGGVPREVSEHVVHGDWAPDGTLALVRREVDPGAQGRLFGSSRIEWPPGRVLHAPGALGEVGVLRVSPRGDRASFVEMQSGKTDPFGSVVVIDRGGRRRTLSGGWNVVGAVAWSPDAREVWFSATRSGLSRSLYAVSLDGRERLLAQLGANVDIRDVSRDGRVLLTQGRVTGEARGRLVDDAEERDYSWLDGTIATTFSRDGRSFFFNEMADGGGARVGAYLRRSDGSPPLKLGDGSPLTLSPDGKWAVCLNADFPRELRLVPTGAGEARTLPRGRVSDYQWAHYLPDGRGLLVGGNEKDHPTRLWLQELPDGEPVPFTPEGTAIVNAAFTADGRFVAATSAAARGTWSLYPLAGGEPRPIRGVEPADTPIRFTADGRSLVVTEARVLPTRVVRIDLATGERSLWLDLAPPDRAGVRGIAWVDVTEDGRSYLYNYWRTLSDLYVVTGLR